MIEWTALERACLDVTGVSRYTPSIRCKQDSGMKEVGGAAPCPPFLQVFSPPAYLFSLSFSLLGRLFLPRWSFSFLFRLGFGLTKLHFTPFSAREHCASEQRCPKCDLKISAPTGGSTHARNEAEHGSRLSAQGRGCRATCQTL